MMPNRLDTTYTVSTPEGIALKLSPSGPVPRVLAWIVDLLIRTALNIALFIALSYFDRMGVGIALILIFLLEWFYPVFFELRYAGQTPGKKLMNIYVAQLDASPVSPGASVVRNLLRAVDFLPFLYGFGLMSIMLTRRFQRLGDLAANTVVLHKPDNRVPNQEFDAPARPPVARLTPAEQQAIILFAQRQQELTVARQQELAAMSGSLASDENDPAACVRGIASWLIGKGA